MRITHVFTSLMGAVAVTSLLMGCDSGPTNVMNLVILGPGSLTPGSSATYSVREHLPGGATRMAESAIWTSSNRSVLEITRSGAATAQLVNGETIVSVNSSGLIRAMEVIVLPKATFRLVGRVIDAISNLGLSEARVEVAGGPAATTDASGAYRLYGVPASLEIRVTRHGYGAVVEPIQLPGHSTKDFPLLADTTSPNYAGHYTLTVQAACTASDKPLTQELQRRTYDAQILQYGASLEVRLSGARFQSTARFKGQVTAGGANFAIERDYYFADLVEVLMDDSSLTVYGTSTTRGSPSGVSGPLVGEFVHVGGFRDPGVRGYCPASTFSLVPK